MLEKPSLFREAKEDPQRLPQPSHPRESNRHQARPSFGLTDDETAFYDALAANKFAVIAMGDDKLKVIAAELITKVRQSVTID